MTHETVIIGSATLIRGDCVAVMPTLGPVDSIVCDPPYHLSEVPHVASGGFGGTRTSDKREARSGFMGQQWDGGDIAFRPETWRTAFDVLRPGGFLLAFGGTRTWHRMACAIEDAGFVIQDTIAWVYGTGFPKNKALLKPAFEPVVMAYKPGGKRELSIDECRIPTNGEDMGDPHRFAKSSEHEGWSRPSHTPEHIAKRGERAIATASSLGRWPANLCHDGSDEVLAGFPEPHGAGAACDPKFPMRHDNRIYGQIKHGTLKGYRVGDSGSAARFFYCAKASKQDRAGSRHPTVKPQALMRWLVALVTPPGGTVLDPFGGSGSTAQAALSVGRKPIVIEREAQWFDDAVARVQGMRRDLVVMAAE